MTNGMQGDMVCCETCPAVFHMECLGLAALPEGDWWCPWCVCAICGKNHFEPASLPERSREVHMSQRKCMFAVVPAGGPNLTWASTLSCADTSGLGMLSDPTGTTAQNSHRAGFACTPGLAANSAPNTQQSSINSPAL